MDEFAFDFERGLEQNVGQPVEPPPSMPASGRKNYRMARAGAMLASDGAAHPVARRLCAATGCAACA
jgi:hypothetical protein